VAEPTHQLYIVRLESSARRDLNRLPAKVVEVVFRFLDGPLRENPLRVTKPLGGKYSGYRTGRVGSAWRVLVRVDEVTVIVTVVRVGSRPDVYR
jgi:addiction module RelE/StbE family toxin